MAHGNIALWVGFNAFVFLMLALDLGVFHRQSHKIKFKESLTWTAVWIGLALIFNAGLYHFFGKQPALEFLTGYVIEKSLSVDNIFVILMIFTFFRVPDKYQHKVLFWGILGALFMRAAFIFAGVALINRYHWIIFVFGGFLVVSGIKMMLPAKAEVSLDQNIVMKLLRRVVPVTNSYHGGDFFVVEKHRRMATPLFAALIMVEITDLIFAMDSIPAILAISSDPFIVYTSNVFAILGLRSLFFAVSGLMDLFHHLKIGLSVILVFVGTKMLIEDYYKVPTGLALMTILGVLALSVVASLIWPPRGESKDTKEAVK